MKPRYRRGALTTLVMALLATFLTPALAGAQESDSYWGNRAPARYQITIENLTPGQPLTPPVVAIHDRRADVFDIGDEASAPLANLAENGDVPGLVGALEATRGVRTVAVAATAAGPLLAGESVTIDVEAPRGVRYLSVASMLICSNDGFVGGDSLQLGLRRGEVAEFALNSYDAGTEVNTEDFDDIVPPCGPLSGVDSGGAGTGASNPALAEGGVIHRHDGVDGSGDLVPAVHDWDDPAARLTVRRIDGLRRYEVAITNLTDGQPLTPPIVAAQVASVDVFRRGHTASAGIQALAENGDVPTLVGQLDGTRGVGEIEVGSGPILPGATQTVTVWAKPHETRFFFGSMLICTNDGFAAVDGGRLPIHVGADRHYAVRSYDAGTELNTELFADLVPPCGPLSGVDSGGQGTGSSDPALAENGVVRRHRGIGGGGDLSVDLHDWDDPSASITVTRVG